jgi:intracellular sulfur oxidation DsrE/DsrF family protein
MQKRHFFAFLTALTLGISAIAQSAPVVTDKPARLVMQISDNDPAKWNLVMNNAHNVQKALGAKNVEIEIVAFGPGIKMVTLDSAAASRVTEMVEQGVKVFACENTMHGLKLTKEDMNPSVGYVPSGVVEIMQRQLQGWAYIRP